MRVLIPDVISAEEVSIFEQFPMGRNVLFDEVPVIKRIKDLLQEHIPETIVWQKPTYMRIEEKNRGHPWHKDTGTANHMMWCSYGASISLQDGTDEEVAYIEYEDGEIVRNYLSLAIHSADQVHRVPSNEKRRTFLCFLKTIQE